MLFSVPTHAGNCSILFRYKYSSRMLLKLSTRVTGSSESLLSPKLRCSMRVHFSKALVSMAMEFFLASSSTSSTMAPISSGSDSSLLEPIKRRFIFVHEATCGGNIVRAFSLNEHISRLVQASIDGGRDVSRLEPHENTRRLDQFPEDKGRDVI